MRLVLFCVTAWLTVACGRPPASLPADAAVPPSTASPASTVPADTTSFPVSVAGTGFADAAGRPFQWRGVTAFRLAEMLASGREADVAVYLDWAVSQQFTVVRVLLMAQHLFTLTPEAGRDALPRLLEMAKARGLAVEVVALADTKDIALDYDAHVREVGRVVSEKGNAFLEIANEPGHATQDARLHDPVEVRRLAGLVPEAVVVALGSAEYADAYSGGDYATFHFPRGRDWQHVLGLESGAALLARWHKPVINDEPIGAAAEYREGRRDNLPARFAAAAALTRFLGMGATFHYEGGLQARLPDAVEAACLDAWTKGLALATEVSGDGVVLIGTGISELAQIGGARAAYARQFPDRAIVLLLDPGPNLTVKWSAGWREDRRDTTQGALIVVATRTNQKRGGEGRREKGEGRSARRT